MNIKHEQNFQTKRKIIQIKIALSMDKVGILIQIFGMRFDSGDKMNVW